MTAPAATRMTYAEYLAAEQASAVRHEYLRGQVFAMAGGTSEHAALATAVRIQLGTALQNKPCRVFGSDLRVRIEGTDLSTHPDVSVVCGHLERSEIDPNAATNPVLIVEVLSDGTEAYDRGEKFAHYRRLTSLREYLLVSQRTPHLKLYRRNAAGHWVLFEAGAGESLELESIGGVKIDVNGVYRDPLAG